MSDSAAKPSSTLDDSSGKTPNDTAFKCPAAIVLFAAVAVSGLAADLLSKHYVFKSMLAEPAVAARAEATAARLGKHNAPDTILHCLDLHRQVFPGVRFTLSTNPGVVFGLSMPRWLVAAATAATIVLVLFFFAASRAKNHLLHLALGCILSGAVGNLYDRLFARVVLPGGDVIRHQVRDFIDCSGLYYPWVFNIADVLLVVGVVLMLSHSIIAERRAKKQV